MKTQRKGGEITSDNGIRNCLVPTWLIIPHISLCGRSFWRRLFVSQCDWNSNDCRLVWLFAEREAQADILQYYWLKHGNRASRNSEVHFLFFSQFCLAAGHLDHWGHYLRCMIVIINWNCVQTCSSAWASLLATVCWVGGGEPEDGLDGQVYPSPWPLPPPNKNDVTTTISVKIKSRCNAHAKTVGGNSTPNCKTILAN